MEPGHETHSNSAPKTLHLTDANAAIDLIDAVDFILTDCDGVIYLHNQIIPETPQVFAKFRQAGKKVLFVSNNSTRSRLQVQSKLKKMGFDVSLDEVFVSAYVAAEYFKSKDFKDKVRSTTLQPFVCIRHSNTSSRKNSLTIHLHSQVYIFGCQGIKDELDQQGINNFGVGPDPLLESSDTLVPPVTLDNSIQGVIVGYDNLISLPKLVKVSFKIFQIIVMVLTLSCFFPPLEFK